MKFCFFFLVSFLNMVYATDGLKPWYDTLPPLASINLNADCYIHFYDGQRKGEKIGGIFPGMNVVVDLTIGHHTCEKEFEIPSNWMDDIHFIFSQNGKEVKISKVRYYPRFKLGKLYANITTGTATGSLKVPIGEELIFRVVLYTNEIVPKLEGKFTLTAILGKDKDRCDRVSVWEDLEFTETKDPKKANPIEQGLIDLNRVKVAFAEGRYADVISIGSNLMQNDSLYWLSLCFFDHHMIFSFVQLKKYDEATRLCQGLIKHHEDNFGQISAFLISCYKDLIVDIDKERKKNQGK